MALNSLVFCFIRPTEFDNSANIVAKIRDNKGIYSNTVTKKVTHVVCSGPDYKESEKYKKAKRLGIPCVTEKWLDVAIHNGRKHKRLPLESDFDPDNGLSINESIDMELDDAAPSVKQAKKAGGSDDLAEASPIKVKFVPLDFVLQGWHVFITGKHERSHVDLKKLIERHGGTVAQTPSAKVTYYMGDGKGVDQCESFGASSITEDGLLLAIELAQEKEAKAKALLESPNKLLASPAKKAGGSQEVKSPQKLAASPKKRAPARKVEKILRRRLVRGAPFYEVQYVGFEDEPGELLAAEDVILAGGEKVLKAFDAKYKKEMASAFDIGAFFADAPDEDDAFLPVSPKKTKKTKVAKSLSDKKSPKKANPKAASPKTKATAKSPTKKQQAVKEAKAAKKASPKRASKKAEKNASEGASSEGEMEVEEKARPVVARKNSKKTNVTAAASEDEEETASKSSKSKESSKAKKPAKKPSPAKTKKAAAESPSKKAASPKKPAANAKQASPKDAEVTDSAKKKRGRPAKAQTEAATEQPKGKKKKT